MPYHISVFFFFSSRRRHTRCLSDWSSDVCSSDLSPANRLIVGMVLAEPPVIVTEPWALRKPLAVATTTYVPAGACKVKVPSELAFTVAANELSVLYKLTVTGLLAFTCPVRDPGGIGVADAVGVDVKVGVGDKSGVNVNEGVGDTVGVDGFVVAAVA